MTSPAETEREIARTRADLGVTLDALERKLAVRHVVEEGFDVLMDDMGGREALNRSFDIVRNNPVPVALIGVGIAWLVAANSIPDEQLAQARDKVVGVAGDIGARAGEFASGIGDKIGLRGNGNGALGHTGNAMVDSGGASGSSGWLHQMADMTQDALRTARDSGGALLDRASTVAGGAAVTDQLSAAYERNPLMVGAVAAMAGALLAAFLPMTRFEDRMLRDGQLQRKAAAAGEQVVSRVREATAEKLEAAAAAVKGDAETTSHL
ncbi:MAG: DUF3618 domain-containing protein [Thiohalocapsa sp.]